MTAGPIERALSPLHKTSVNCTGVAEGNGVAEEIADAVSAADGVASAGGGETIGASSVSCPGVNRGSGNSEHNKTKTTLRRAENFIRLLSAILPGVRARLQRNSARSYGALAGKAWLLLMI